MLFTVTELTKEEAAQHEANGPGLASKAFGKVTSGIGTVGGAAKSGLVGVGGAVGTGIGNVGGKIGGAIGGVLHLGDSEADQ